MPESPSATAIHRLVTEQGGVIARSQVLALGGTQSLITHQLRRRVWARLLPGVYVDHTGAPTDSQRATAAVLSAGFSEGRPRAALAHEWALHADGVRNLTLPPAVQVVVPAERRVRAASGIVVFRARRLEPMVQWNRMPPRLRLEDATLGVASRALARNRERDAIAVLADVCQQRRTTAARLLTCLDERHPCLPGRRFLRTILADVASGTYSVLEHRYLTRVERPHRLPRARRQGPTAGKVGYRDIHYVAQNTVIELDGRLGHEWDADRWADLERDLLNACADQLTTRIGYGQVLEACRLSRLVGRLLQVRGWAGQPMPCPACQ